MGEITSAVAANPHWYNLNEVPLRYVTQFECGALSLLQKFSDPYPPPVMINSTNGVNKYQSMNKAVKLPIKRMTKWPPNAAFPEKYELIFPTGVLFALPTPCDFPLEMGNFRDNFLDTST